MEVRAGGAVKGKDDGCGGRMFAASIVSHTGRGSRFFVLLQGTLSVEKQEARGPAHPHG